jgi:hypothetical protein
MKCENQEAIAKIQEDISDIKENLAEHMARTKASEDRLTLIENKLLDKDQIQYDRFMQMDKANKAFTYKVLVGFVMAGLLPFLLKLLGIVS